MSTSDTGRTNASTEPRLRAQHPSGVEAPNRTSESQNIPSNNSSPESTPQGEPPQLSKGEYEARIVDELYGSVVLEGIAGKNLGSKVSGIGYKTHRDNVLAASGSQDPIEVMMVEQLMWAHHRLGALHYQAAESKTVEAAAMFGAAAARLMAECRKMSLALREYRSPVVPKQLTVVRQQNLAGGNQQIALIEGTPGEIAPENAADSELGTKQGLLNHVEHTNLFATADRRTVEPVEAPRLDGHRPAAAP